VRTPRPGGGRGPAIRGALAPVSVFVVLLGCLLQARYGYESGTDDHLVLSLQGLQWGRPGFLADDWFVRSAPQPHVLFDVVTWAGARSGHLSLVYLAWWLLGLAVGGIATALLARVWTPRRPLTATAAVAAALALGPKTMLGSTTPALPIALPHELGGFLAYLTGALLLTRRPRAAAVACVLTAAVHVQIGALVAVVCVLAAGAVRLTERRWWWWPLGGAGLSGAIVAGVLRARPVAASPDDFVQICRDVIPFHCDVPTWPADRFVSGACVLLTALAGAVLVRRQRLSPLPLARPAPSPGVPPAGAPARRPRISPDGGLWLAVVLVPAVGLAAGVLAAGFGVPVVGRLAQTTNIFRLAVLVLPFGAWGLAAGVARLSRPRRTAWAAAVLVAGYGWFAPAGTEALLAGHLGWVVAALLLAAAAVVVHLAGHRTAATGLPGTTARTRAAGALAVLVAGTIVAGAVITGAVQWRVPRIGFVSDPAARATGREVARHVPAGEVVEVPPTYGVVRLAAGRSVVVDCKAVPYGGDAWRDYRARLDALGGPGACHNGGRPYAVLPASTLVAVADRYHARYLALARTDRRWRDVRDQGWHLLAGPKGRVGGVWLLAAPGAPDAALP